MCMENGDSMIKDTLKSLCCSNGWSYGFLWGFNNRNSSQPANSPDESASIGYTSLQPVTSTGIESITAWIKCLNSEVDENQRSSVSNANLAAKSRPTVHPQPLQEPHFLLLGPSFLE
ncbi:transcription factor LHW [Abeliophyllum distichum]|uniref:Transcription factor LHW n=1 Tax=Abeliophyllum distichum TaxID=126358 RepID=A0ABD1RS18_9LAMI